MADVTIFDARLGDSAGRLAPTQAAPREGTYVVALGEEGAPARFVSGGDFIEHSQTAAFPPEPRLVRPGVFMRGAIPPIDAYWTFSALKEGEERVEIRLPRRRRSRSLNDVAIPLEPAGETCNIGFRLTLHDAGIDVEAEIPLVYVDAIVEDKSPEAILCINRDPEPDETAVPVTSAVVVEIHNPTAGFVDPSTVTVYIGGVLAMSGGVVQPGFSGGYTVLDARRTVRVTLTPDFPFESLTKYDVLAYGSDYGDPPELVASYFFITEDLIAPRLISATAIDHMLVRVAFNEPVVAADASALVDALNPANWTITITSTSIDDGLPAVPLDVVSVAPAIGSDGTQFDLTLNIDMTPGAHYLATVSGAVTDLWDNVMDPAYVSAPFTGYACPWPERRRFRLWNMLPELNRREDRTQSQNDHTTGTRDLEKLVKCWQEIFDLIICDIDRWTQILDPDFAPEPFVDAMLADLGNPFAFPLTLNDKRKLCRALVSLYQKKGTADGIKEIVNFFLGIEVDVVPALDGGGWVLDVSMLDVDTDLTTYNQALLYSFYVTSNEFLTAEQENVIHEIALYAKPAHTHLIAIVGQTVPISVDHWQMNLSDLGINTDLHGP